MKMKGPDETVRSYSWGSRGWVTERKTFIQQTFTEQPMNSDAASLCCCCTKRSHRFTQEAFYQWWTQTGCSFSMKVCVHGGTLLHVNERLHLWAQRHLSLTTLHSVLITSVPGWTHSLKWSFRYRETPQTFHEIPSMDSDHLSTVSDVVELFGYLRLKTEES